MVDDLEDADSYPIPATRNSFLAGRGTPELWNGYARNHGLLSFASFAGVGMMLMRK